MILRRFTLPLVGLCLSLVSYSQNGAIDTTYTPDGEMHLNIMPLYPGGRDALNTDISKSFVMPKAAKKDDLHGLVLIEFIVDKNGSITKPNIIKGLREDVDAAALEAVNGLKPFTPATMDGEAVPFGITLPIKL